MRNVNIILLFILLNGCFQSEVKFGKEYNSERVKMGLEEIPAGWKESEIMNSYISWINPQAEKLLNEGKPVFFSKIVSFDGEKFKAESDLYYSGKKFNTVDGLVSESINKKYYAEPTVVGYEKLQGMQCVYSGPVDTLKGMEGKDEIFNATLVYISVQKCDSILKSWGLTVPGVSEK